MLDASGATAAAYRKVHLFDVDVPNGPVLMESRTTAPGDKVLMHAAAAWAVLHPALFKVHLCDVDVLKGPVLMESRTTAPGDKVSTRVAACDSTSLFIKYCSR